MNHRMWSHPATQANSESLLARGVELTGPDEGDLAEGEWGVGRMTEPEEIFLVRIPPGLARAFVKRCEQVLGAGRPEVTNPIHAPALSVL
jgi:phosphopantothenoylcysteine synthetase/decarboxylase